MRNNLSKILGISILFALIISALGVSPSKGAGTYTHSWFVESAIIKLNNFGGYSELVDILNRYPEIVNYGAIFPDLMYGGVDDNYSEGMHDTDPVNDRYARYLEYLSDNSLDRNNNNLQTGYYKNFLENPNYTTLVPKFRRALMGQILENFTNYPRTAEDEKMIAFLFGVIAHQEADMAWHWKDPEWLGLEEYAKVHGYNNCGYIWPFDQLNQPEMCLDIVLRNAETPDHVIDTTTLSLYEPVVRQAGEVAGMTGPRCNGGTIPGTCSSTTDDPFFEGQDQILWLWTIQIANHKEDNGWVSFVNTYIPGGIDNGSAFIAGAWMETWNILNGTSPFYVKVGGTGDCRDWENACELRYALGHTLPGREVWVAAGVYKPTAVDGIPTDADRKATFQLLPNIFGGFNGTETSLDQRNPAENITILSGDIDNNDTNSDNNKIAENSTDIVGNNSIHVVTGASGATLDGFTITAGNADGDTCPGTACGGGMQNVYTFPIITNVTFSGNAAVSGGGMYNWTDLFNLSGPTIMNVTFRGNSATTNGGGIYNELSRPSITNLTFSGNTAVNNGGGMFNHTQLTMQNTVRNVTLSGNHAGNAGGGVYNYFGTVQYQNTIFWGNTAPNGDQAYEEGSALSIYNSIVQGGCPMNVDCGNIYNNDPILGLLGDYGGSTPTIPIQEGSSAIDTGNAASCPDTDQRGLDRPQRDGCDIGAYELGVQVVSLSPSTHDFGSQVVGTTSATQTFILTNTGTADLHIGTLSISGQFGLVNNLCNNSTLMPNATCSFRLTFKPLAAGIQTGEVSIPSDATTSPDQVILSGNGAIGTQLLRMWDFEGLPNPLPWKVSWPTWDIISLRNCAISVSPSCSTKLIGTSRGFSFTIQQVINRNGRAGDMIYFGLSSRAQNIPTGGQYKVQVIFSNARGLVGSRTFVFNNGTHAFQTLGVNYIVPVDYSGILYRITFQKSSGIAWFDDAMLVLYP